MRVANGDAWGLVQMGAGGLGFAGSLTYAASNPGLNALGGVGPSSGGFAQGFVNWWNLGHPRSAQYARTSRKQFLISLRAERHEPRVFGWPENPLLPRRTLLSV
jgi:hypothetical protein